MFWKSREHDQLNTRSVSAWKSYTRVTSVGHACSTSLEDSRGDIYMLTFTWDHSSWTSCSLQRSNAREGGKNLQFSKLSWKLWCFDGDISSCASQDTVSFLSCGRKHSKKGIWCRNVHKYRRYHLVPPGFFLLLTLEVILSIRLWSCIRGHVSVALRRSCIFTE